MTLKPHDAFYELLAWVLLMSAATLMMSALQQALSVVPASPILAIMISVVLFLVAMRIRRRHKR
jgi:hypothetical protein